MFPVFQRQCDPLSEQPYKRHLGYRNDLGIHSARVENETFTAQASEVHEGAGWTESWKMLALQSRGEKRTGENGAKEAERGKILLTLQRHRDRQRSSIAG